MPEAGYSYSHFSGTKTRLVLNWASVFPVFSVDLEFSKLASIHFLCEGGVRLLPSCNHLSESRRSVLLLLFVSRSCWKVSIFKAAPPTPGSASVMHVSFLHSRQARHLPAGRSDTSVPLYFPTFLSVVLCWTFCLFLYNLTSTIRIRRAVNKLNSGSH